MSAISMSRPSAGVPPRLLATTLLALIALGGAGLAVAADRFQASYQDPELTWAADHAAQPHISTLDSDLSSIDSAASDVAKAGRDTLGNLQTLNLDATRAALASGDDAAMKISAALPRLGADHDSLGVAVDRSRLGPGTGAQLAAIDVAVSAVPEVAQAWNSIHGRASAMAELIGDLQRHDSFVFQATTSGRQQKWADALSSLASAEAALNSVAVQGSELATGGTTDTLDELVARYSAYDSALTSLYSYLGSGGAQGTSRFDALNTAVADAQAALPGDSGIYSIIVGEGAGAAIGTALVQLEQARDGVNAALTPASSDRSDQ